MYLFHSHNIVGCLASIGDSDKMNTYTQGGYICRSDCQSSPTISTVAFFFRHSFFLCATLRVRKITAITARSYIHYQEKRVPKRRNKPIKNAVATATLGGHGQVSGSIHPMSSR